MILIDTQALVWLVEANPKLGGKARAIVESERTAGGVLISAIAGWETAMLVDKGRLVLSRPVAMWFDAVLAAPGFRLAELSVAIGVDAGSLPGAMHGDPADRIVIATARVLGCALVTADRAILAYAAAGHLRAIDARH